MTRFYLFIARWSLKVNAWAQRKACPGVVGSGPWRRFRFEFNDEFRFSAKGGDR